MQYLISPRVNIESDPSFGIFSIVRYKPDIAGNARLYLSAQWLNTFDTSDHIKSINGFVRDWTSREPSLGWP